MENLTFDDLEKEIRNKLVYPKEKLCTRLDATRILQMSLYSFDKLRREGQFSEIEILGVKFFAKQELFNWAYRNKPQVINFRLQFDQSKQVFCQI